MHDAALACAALPAPTAVMGLLMQPYSLGHELFLIREDNPLVTGTRPPTLADLAQAALICCQGWDQNRSMWRDRMIGLKLWILKRRWRKRDVTDEMAAFSEYLSDGRREFPTSPLVDDTTGRVLGTPFLLRVHQFLCTKLRLKQAEAWDYPMGLAVMQWECFYECRGGIKILNRAEATHLEFVRRMDEEEAKCRV